MCMRSIVTHNVTYIMPLYIVGMCTQIHVCTCTMPAMVYMMHVCTVNAFVCIFVKYKVDVLHDFL